jgi:hypothetical protein
VNYNHGVLVGLLRPAEANRTERKGGLGVWPGHAAYAVLVAGGHAR